MNIVPDDPVPHVPPPSEPPRSYEVRIRRTVGGTVCLVGHNGRGEPVMELRIAEAHLRPDVVQRIQEWCRAFDVAPALGLVD